MANSWAIKIVTLDDGTVTFQPDLPGAQPGQPLGADVGDNITWNNETNHAHWPEATDPPGVFLTNDIPAGQVSNPIFNVPHSVEYRCRYHPLEVGRIEVPGVTS